MESGQTKAPSEAVVIQTREKPFNNSTGTVKPWAAKIARSFSMEKSKSKVNASVVRVCACVRAYVCALRERVVDSARPP